MYFSLKSPGKRTPSRFPSRAPMGREAGLQGISHLSQKPHLSGSPVEEPYLKVSLMESLAERCPTTRALLYSSINVPGIRALPPPPTYQVPLGLTLRRLMLYIYIYIYIYIYGAPILDVSRSHTTTQHSR